MKAWSLAGILVLLTGCATNVPPEVVTGYKAPQDIEAYCAEKGAGEKQEWIAQCTNRVSFRVRSTSFCEACDSKGGNMNACLREAQKMRETTIAGMRARKDKGQPPIVLSCAATTAICTGFPDSGTERDMKVNREAKAKFDMKSYPGAYCPIRKSGTR